MEILDTGVNAGYSGGINRARELVGPGPLAILNPDLVLEPLALQTLVAELRDEVGIAVPLLLDEKGRVAPHLRKEPSVLGSLGDALFGARWPGRPRLLTDDLRRPEDYTQPRDVAWAGAAAWVVSAACNTAVGAWDSERFFLYSEETDYARRARDLGFRVRFVPAARAHHVGGGSGTSPALLALMAVNRVRYYAARHGRPRTVLFAGSVALGHVLRAPLSAGHRRAARTVCRPSTWSALPRAESAPGRRPAAEHRP